MLIEQLPQGRRARRSRATRPYAHATAIVAAVTGLALVVAGLVDLTDSGDDALALVGLGVPVAAVGFAGLSRLQPAARVQDASGHILVTLVWVELILVATVAYLLTGTFDRIDDALFEAVAGFTTTSATVLIDPASTGRGVLFWRATTQLLGGLGGLMLVAVVLPRLAGLSHLGDDVEHTRVGARLAPSPLVGLRRTTFVYGATWAAVVVAYALAGMGPFDAVTYAMTTVSTGGFANHAGSIAHFDSASIETVAIVAMLVAGTGAGTLWWALHRRVRQALHVEFRAYLALVVVGSVLAVLWDGRVEDAAGFRRAVFSVVSAATTTGYRVDEWALWLPSGQILLLLLVTVGAMTRSTSGGLGILRALTVLQAVRRTLAYELHPRLVAVVKVGGHPVPEPALARLVGDTIHVFTLVGVGSVALASLGEDLFEALSAAISALSNFGPVVGETSAFADATVHTAPARAVLIPLMLAGRLAVHPLFVTVGAGLEWPDRLWRLWRDRSDDRRERS